MPDTIPSLLTATPAYRLMARIGLAGSDPKITPRRVIVSICLTWLPMAILAAVEKNFINSQIELHFAEDYAVHTRFLVALPMLLVLGKTVEPRLHQLIDYLQASRIVPEGEKAALKDAVDNLRRRSESVVLELMLLIAAFALSVWVSLDPPVDVSSWYYRPGAEGPSHLRLAGWWHAFVATPFYVFVLFRWFRFMTMWALFLRRVSKLDLDLTPTHPDGSGGLGLIALSQMAFTGLFFASGIALSGSLANGMIHDDMTFDTARVTAITFALAGAALIYAPLLFFTRILFEARCNGLAQYGALGDRLVTSFGDKWIEPTPPPDGLLGSTDPSAMADYEATFKTAEGMRFIPMRVMDFVRVAIILVLPFVPLVLTQMSFVDAVKKLVSVVMG